MTSQPRPTEGDRPRVGVLLIATNKYGQFVEPLVDSIRTSFLTDCDVTVFLFTDQFLSLEDVVQLPVEHQPWPLVTLRRYHVFDRYRQALVPNDYVFYLDVDMLVAGSVGREILPRPPYELVATVHPGFFEDGKRGTYEERTESTACVSGEEGTDYFVGAFNGGRTEAFLQMSATLARNIDRDLDGGIVAVWHDESHLNRYLIDHPPQALPPSYCYPESAQLPFEPIILALDKDHEAMRSP